MFLETIKIIETSPCLAERKLFKAVTRASVSLTEILPYLNSILEKPNYQLNPVSLAFNKGIIGITIQDDKISLTRFANITEAFEILDWLKDLINDTYESRDEIPPNYNGLKQVGLLKIYSFLPKKNCKKCGEPSCMAFAGRLSQYDAEIEDCPLLADREYKEFRDKLEKAFRN